MKEVVFLKVREGRGVRNGCVEGERAFGITG